MCRRVRGRFETCPYGCFLVAGGGSAPSLCLSPGGGEIGRLGEAGELFEVLEVSEDLFEELLVVLGCGAGLGLVVTTVAGGAVVARRSVAAGGAVFFRHVGSEEHHQEGRRGVGLLCALEEHDFKQVGVPEDGYFESIVESEGIFDLPMPGGADGYARIIGGDADGAGRGELVEIDGLQDPCIAIFGGEVVEPDAEIAFEFVGLLLGGDSDCCEINGHWGSGERRKNYVGV